MSSIRRFSCPRWICVVSCLKASLKELFQGQVCLQSQVQEQKRPQRTQGWRWWPRVTPQDCPALLCLLANIETSTTRLMENRLKCGVLCYFLAWFIFPLSPCSPCCIFLGNLEGKKRKLFHFCRTLPSPACALWPGLTPVTKWVAKRVRGRKPRAPRVALGKIWQEGASKEMILVFPITTARLAWGFIQCHPGGSPWWGRGHGSDAESSSSSLLMQLQHWGLVFGMVFPNEPTLEPAEIQAGATAFPAACFPPAVVGFFHVVTQHVETLETQPGATGRCPKAG